MTLNLYLPLLWLCILFSHLFAQETNSGPRFTALGNTAVALQDVWSMQGNPAGIASLQKPAAAIAYKSTYLTTDISTQSAVAAYPIKNNVVGLALQRYGFSAYSEQKIAVGYAKRFGKYLFAAINLNAHQVKINHYGSSQAYSVDAGMQFRVNPKLLIGTHITNPNKSAYNRQVEAFVPTCLSLGAAYSFSDKVILSTALVKDLDVLTDARFGLEYTMSQWLSLRGGINVNHFSQFAGFGCNYQQLRIDGAVSSHPVLGYSPQLSLGYEF